MIGTNLNKDKICVVIVSYNPNLDEFLPLLETMSESRTKVCIIDNSTEPQKQSIIMNLHIKNITVKTLFENKGIAYAQNIGMAWAFGNGYAAVLLSDQDSVITNKIISGLCKQYNQLRSQGIKVACIAPAIYRRDGDKKIFYTGRNSLNKKADVVEVDHIQSSGSLIDKKAYIRVGEMDESLFIDFVDWEWCWRARAIGYKTFMATNIHMAHMLGEGTKEMLFNLRVGMPAVSRHYYQYRNYLILLRRGYMPLKYKIKYFVVYVFKILYYGLFAPSQKERRKQIFRGIKDGIKTWTTKEKFS